MDYGEKWKRHRKYLQQFFHKQNIPKYYNIELKEVHHLLNDFLDDPENFTAHIKRYVIRHTFVHNAEIVLKARGRCDNDAHVWARG